MPLVYHFPARAGSSRDLVHCGFAASISGRRGSSACVVSVRHGWFAMPLTIAGQIDEQRPAAHDRQPRAKRRLRMYPASNATRRSVCAMPGAGRLMSAKVASGMTSVLE